MNRLEMSLMSYYYVGGMDYLQLCMVHCTLMLPFYFYQFLVNGLWYVTEMLC